MLFNKYKNILNKGNFFLKYKEHIIVLFHREYDSVWKYSIDGVFCDTEFSSKELAKEAAINALKDLL